MSPFEKQLREKLFPWPCPKCRQPTVTRVMMPYGCRRKCGGRIVMVEIPNLAVPRCSECGEVVFDYTADEQIRAAFRTHYKGAIVSSILSSTPSIPADVAAIAAEHDISKPLLAVLSLTQQLFPSSSIAPRLEPDAETDDQWAIVVEVDVSGLEPSQLVAAQRQWSEGLFACCPSTHAHLFCLRME